MVLNSNGYKYARKSQKDLTFKIKRLKLLHLRILTRIEKINIYLGNEGLGDKELKTKLSLLSQLIGVKKQVAAEIKELGTGNVKGESSIGDILNN
jgi:hypothetical protein